MVTDSFNLPTRKELGKLAAVGAVALVLLFVVLNAMEWYADSLDHLLNTFAILGIVALYWACVVVVDELAGRVYEWYFTVDGATTADELGGEARGE